MKLRNSGLFDADERLKALSAKSDDLQRIKAVVDFELFRPELERAMPRSNGAKGGRPTFDHLLMFKVLILQAMHSLSDKRYEYLIKVVRSHSLDHFRLEFFGLRSRWLAGFATGIHA
jgi:transposase, IS5 family